MLDWLYSILGDLLAFFSKTGSYAIALLFYALIFKLLFLPFGIKQQKNMIKKPKVKKEKRNLKKPKPTLIGFVIF